MRIILTSVIKGEDYVEEGDSYLENVFVGHWRTACVFIWWVVITGEIMRKLMRQGMRS